MQDGILKRSGYITNQWTQATPIRGPTTLIWDRLAWGEAT
jgi:hypothetical protein